VAPSVLHALFSSVTWWKAHNLLELGTDSYTEIVPAPQGGRRGDYISGKREMAAGEGTGRAGRPPLIGNRVPLMTNSYLVHKH
jgi:hypothetical protein